MAKPHDITVVICAFNAKNTIGRAIKSALAATTGPILLIDDFSTDQTVSIAADIAGDQLTLVRPKEKLGIGNARQTALEATETPFAVWLDADDEILPNRIDAMRRVFAETNADLVFDAAELVDGKSGKVTAQLDMPLFLRGEAIWRLFERNWLPGLWGGFKVNFARKIGYDRQFFNSEDYDFTLRAMAAGAKVQLMEECGYRYYHYPGSVSRNLKEATNFTGKALEKFDLKTLEMTFRRAGVPTAERAYLLASVALLTAQYSTCVSATSVTNTEQKLIEPYGVSASALVSFLAGVAHLKQNNPKLALSYFEACGMNTADCFNNIGVCHTLLADTHAARAFFERAAMLSPAYLDPRQNLEQLETGTATHITLLPLRPLAARSSYL